MAHVLQHECRGSGRALSRTSAARIAVPDRSSASQDSAANEGHSTITLASPSSSVTVTNDAALTSIGLTFCSPSGARTSRQQADYVQGSHYMWTFAGSGNHFDQPGVWQIYLTAHKSGAPNHVYGSQTVTIS